MLNEWCSTTGRALPNFLSFGGECDAVEIEEETTGGGSDAAGSS